VIPIGPGRDALLGDVVAFTALPAVWVGVPPERVARSLAQALDRTLPVEAVAVLLRTEQGIVEAREGKAHLLEHDVGAWRATRPLGASTREIEIGPMGARGVILLRGGALGPDRLLLARLAANLADTALREAALDHQAALSREQLMKLEKLSALGQLVSGVAHELRTPLTYANNNLYLAQTRIARAGTLSADERAALDALLGEVLSAHERIHQTVQTLRRLSSPVASQRGPLLLSEAVSEAARLFSLTHVGPIELILQLGSHARVDGDRVQLQQVVLNLLQNAAEAVGERGLVVVSTADDGQRVRLVVEDNGPGVPVEARGKLFDPFFTTKPAGTGLGLSIVRRILESHGATVAVSESERGGARFEIAFPRVASVDVKAPAAAPSQHARGDVTSS